MAEASLVVFLSSLFSLLCNVAWCQHNCKPVDCVDLRCYRVSVAQDGPHTVYPGVGGLDSLSVSCYQTTSGGGWTILLRRHVMSNDTEFTGRTWEEYKNGFGRQDGPISEFWLGNENIHILTSPYTHNNSELRVEGTAYNQRFHAVSSRLFSLDSEADNYVMHVSGETAVLDTAARMLLFHNNIAFSRGLNDTCQTTDYTGSYWWFNSCNTYFLFGSHSDSNFDIRRHIFLTEVTGRPVALQQARMLYRRDVSRNCDNPCRNGGTCMYVVASDNHRCVCPSTHCGAKCESANYCKNGGTCKYDSANGTNECVCPATFSGPECETDISCNNGGTFHNGNSHCTCPETHCGARCEIENMCKNGGTCQYNSVDGTNQCVCPASHTGANCETDVPCENGGTYHYNSNDGSSHCTCPDTHCGAKCEIANVCQNGGTCQHDAIANSTIKCSCPATHCGPKCEHANICKNGGTCVGSRKCICPHSHCGSACEIANVCKNGGTCLFSSINGTRKCICAGAYTGAMCETDATCLHGGTYNMSTHECICKTTHCGPQCEFKNVCHKGTCSYDKFGTRQCTCLHDYCGPRCEMANMCQNGGTCIYDGATKLYSCKCLPAFPGTKCSAVAAKTTEAVHSDDSPLLLFVFLGTTLLLSLLCLSYLGNVLFMLAEEREQELLAKEQQIKIRRHMSEESTYLLAGPRGRKASSAVMALIGRPSTLQPR